MRKIIACIAAVFLALALSFPHAVNAAYQWTDEQGQLHISDYPKPATAGKHFLWKIRSKTNTVYLLGAIHLLKKDDYPLAGSIEQAYDNSSRLFFEINMDLVDQQKIQQLVIAKGTYTGTRTLKDDLSTQTYEAVRKRSSDMGLDIEQFKMIKPWFLATTLSVGALQKLGYDHNKGIDSYFFEKARKDRKNIDGFETAEYQMGLLGDMPAAIQDMLLLQTLKDIDMIESQMADIVETWKTGQTEILGAILLESFQAHPAIYKALLVDRNKNWLPKIQSLIGQKQNCMIIVGAAHFLGAEGIIALLKQKGYRVEQL